MKFPKACKAYGFKTAGMPSVTVFQSTGSDCIAFAIKERREEYQIKNQKQRENLEKNNHKIFRSL